MTFDDDKENRNEPSTRHDTAVQRARPSPTPAKPHRPRGFAAMDRRQVILIASKGGKAAHRAGTAHEFTSEEARAAGAKGGAKPKEPPSQARPHATEDTGVTESGRPEGDEA